MLFNCKFFLGSDYPGILALCKTNVEDSVNSSNLSLRGYSPSIQKYFVIHEHFLAVYVKEDFHFECDSSLENSDFLFVFSVVFTSLSVSYFFSVDDTILFFVQFRDAVSSYIEKVV